MSYDSKIIVDIFSDIVDSLRATGTITGLSVASGVTTVTSANELSAGEVVEIGGTNYVVRSADSTKFTVNGIGITASTWNALAPYYLFGHPMEISNILLEKDGNVEPYRYQKYPLITLFTDINIKFGEPKVYGELKGLNITIIASSDAGYSTKERYDNVIKPTLIPLYNSFIKKIQKSRYFIGTTPNLNHSVKERPFWGSTSKYGNVANMFNDPLDALELSDITMKLKRGNTCLT